MADNYDIEEKAPPDFNRYLEIARRRYMQFLLPLLVGFLAVWGTTFLLKARYKSTTVILVEQPSMPKNYVMPNVSEDLQQQLASISEQVLSRSRLLAICNKYNLFARSDRQYSPDEKFALMSKKIDVQLVHSDGGGGVTSFSISYTADTPWLAQQITRELANGVMTQNLEVRQRESEDTTSFLDQQLEIARQNLADQTAKVKAYEAAHEGALPEQQQSNLSIMTGLEQQLQSEQDALNQAVSQRAYYQTLIEQYRALRQPVKGADGAAVDVTALDQTLAADRAKLADLLSRYTDSYPDVQALKAEIVRVQKERSDALAAESSGRGGTSAAADSGNPQNAPLAQLEGQLRANQVEITNRQQSIEELKQRIAQYQARLGAEPASAEELADLNRGYDQSQANYNDLLKRRDESQMATSMEQMQQGERFSILDPPTLPWKPDFPNRLAFCALGVVVGLVLGLLSVAIFEFMDDRMYSDKEIKALLPVAVISEIPEIESEADERKARKKVYLGWATAATVVVAILAGAAVSVLHP